MADHSAALRRARQTDSRTKRTRTRQALTGMIETGEPVTFAALARKAGGSVSLLYADVDIATRVAEARDRQRQAGRDRAWKVPPRSLVTEASLRAELANTKERARQLAEEVQSLRSRVALTFGAEADAANGQHLGAVTAELEQRVTVLVQENGGLRRRVSELDATIRDLTDTLDAARAANRDLMSP